jgi:hypothetical protein
VIILDDLEMNPPKNDLKSGVENAGCIAFILLLAFGAFSHFYAWMKCQFGIEAFRVVNQETEESYAIWDFANSN